MVQFVVLGRSGTGEAIPAFIFSRPDRNREPRPYTLVVHSQGKAALLNASQTGPGELLSALLEAGHVVIAIDAFMTGEALPETSAGPARRNLEGKFPWTFYKTDTALRVQDIATAAQYLRAQAPLASRRSLVGVGEAGLWCLLARPFLRGFAATVVDTAQFNTADDSAFEILLFVPSLRRSGDLRVAAALVAPGRLMLHNTGNAFDTSWAENAYQALGASANLRLLRPQAGVDRIVSFLEEP